MAINYVVKFELDLGLTVKRLAVYWIALGRFLTLSLCRESPCEFRSVSPRHIVFVCFVAASSFSVSTTLIADQVRFSSSPYHLLPSCYHCCLGKLFS